MASNSTWRGEVGEGGLFKKQQKSKLDNEGEYYFVVVRPDIQLRELFVSHFCGIPTVLLQLEVKQKLTQPLFFPFLFRVSPLLFSSPHCSPLTNQRGGGGCRSRDVTIASFFFFLSEQHTHTPHTRCFIQYLKVTSCEIVTRSMR